MEFTKYEKESLISLLAEMNYYEMMAIISKFCDDSLEMENIRSSLLSAYNKLVSNYSLSNGCPDCGCKDGNHAQECEIYYNAGYGKRLEE